MISLGSPELDSIYIPDILKKIKLYEWTNKNITLHDEYVNFKTRWFLEEIIQNSIYYQVPNYQDVFRSRNLESGLSEYPILDKNKLREMSEDFASKQGGNNFFHPQTSGSTGVTIRMWFDHEYYISFFSRLCYFLQVNHLWPEASSTCMISLTPFKHSDEYSIQQPAVNNSYFYRISIHPSKWESPSDVVNRVALKAPMIIRGMPTSLDLLSEFIEKNPPSKPILPKILISTQETLLPKTRMKLQQAYRTSVFDEYGLTEVGGVVAQECREHCGFHINTVDYIVEVVDSQGYPVDDGIEGEILITNLYNRLVPLLRYRSGDFGMITHEPCKCGSVAPRISRFSGRALTRFNKRDGKSYNPWDSFGEFLWKLPITQFQMVQKGISEITLFYRGVQNIEDHEVTQELKQKISDTYEGKITFNIIRVEQFDHEGKFQSFLHIEPS